MLSRVGLILLVYSLCAGAEEHQPLSIERLTREADLIIRATVYSQTVQKDDKGLIYTTVQLDAAETWKGELPAKRIELVHGGGVLGEIGRKVRGQAEFDLEEKVVLFLTANGKGSFVTVGMADGKFRVTQQEGNQLLAVRTGAESSIPLSELEEKVQRSLHE